MLECCEKNRSVCRTKCMQNNIAFSHSGETNSIGASHHPVIAMS